jgi:hypothetical protein
MKKLFMLALCGIGLLTLGSPAQAIPIPITGEIHFAGLWAPTGGSGILNAKGIDFSSGGYQIVLAATGDLVAPVATPVVFQNFTFDPVLSPSPVVSLWSFSNGGVSYSFDLTAVAVAFQSGTQLVLTGKGILHATGFENTEADWDFTGNSGGTLFSFSADNVAVPEPITVGLLGLGLIGLTAAGTKQARRIR